MLLHRISYFSTKILFLFINFYIFYFNGFVYASQSGGFTECKLGKCEKWNMIVVPMLRRETGDHLNALKDLIETVIGDCKWYYGYINVQFVTKNLELIRVTDPVDFSDLDERLDEFIYHSYEREEAYEKLLKHAIFHLPTWPLDYGRYILMLTNFERELSGIVIENNKELKNKIEDFGIQLRTIRVEFDGKKATNLNFDQIFSINRIRNISSNYVRVSFIETQSMLTTVQPCPRLTPQERLDHYRYGRHYLAEHWFEKNSISGFIGGILIAISIIGVIFAYFYKYKENFSSDVSPIINT